MAKLPKKILLDPRIKLQDLKVSTKTLTEIPTVITQTPKRQNKLLKNMNLK